MSSADHNIVMAQHRAAIDMIIALEARQQRVAPIYFAMTSALVIGALTAAKLEMGFPEPLMIVGVIQVSIVWVWYILSIRQLLQEEKDLLFAIEKELPIQSIETKQSIRNNNRSFLKFDNVDAPNIVIPLTIGFIAMFWVFVSFWLGLPGFRI